MPRSANDPEYSIAAVSKLTGVSCHVLRVWERRYGYPIPRRSASNQRRYGIDQVHALRELALLTRSGRPIGELIGALKSGRLGVGTNPVETALAETGPAWPSVGEALFAGDVEAGDALIDEMAARMTPVELLTRLIEPMLIEIGERWYRGEIKVYQEHMASGVLLRTLGRMLHEARRANVGPSRRALVATVQGDHHEGGALILALMLELSGWRALPLGADLPVAELREAVNAWKPDAVGVSFVLSRSINRRFAELGAIGGPPIFVGGRSVMNHKGLARSYGLIPLAGPISSVLPLWLAEFEGLRAGDLGRLA